MSAYYVSSNSLDARYGSKTDENLPSRRLHFN